MRTPNWLPIIVLALSLGGSTIAAQDSRAEAVLNAARQALGGAEKLAAIKGVLANGTHHRSMGEIQATGDTQIEITLPDKYLRSQTDQIFGNSVTIETGFDGEEPVQRSNSVGGGGPNVVFRMAGPGASGAKAEDPAVFKANQLRAQHAELTRLMLGWFTMAPAFMEATYSYAGVAESPDGRADVIDVKGRDNFAAKLFIDEDTHRPLMLTYMGVKPVVRVMRTAGGAHGAPAPAGAEESSRRADQVARDASQEPPSLVEMQLYFDDYRQVGGVWLPHHVSRSINGETNEEIEFQKFQIK